MSRNGTTLCRIVGSEDGTLIVCDRHREFYGIRGRVAGSVMKAFGALILRRQLRSGIKRSIRLHAMR